MINLHLYFCPAFIDRFSCRITDVNFCGGLQMCVKYKNKTR